jgi:hypothetical protein
MHVAPLILLLVPRWVGFVMSTGIKPSGLIVMSLVSKGLGILVGFKIGNEGSRSRDSS